MKLIDLLLRLYPGEFRARYEKEMRAFHDERARENEGSLRVISDHLRSAIAEQAHAAGPDVRFALRGMFKRPGFAAVIVVTIALGVGANAAIFSVVNGILLRPLPYKEVDRLVTLAHRPPHWLVSEPQYDVYRDTIRSFESVAAYTNSEGNLTTVEEPERVVTAGVTMNFFATLGVQPMLGRAFVPGDDASRPFPVIILSHDVWSRRFNADPAIVGKSVGLNGTPRTVVGVMPPRFEYPSKNTEVWLPHCSLRTCVSLTTQQPDTLDGWANHYLHLVARLRPGYTVEQAVRELAALDRKIVREHPGNFNPADPLVSVVRDLRDDIVGSARPYLMALLGAVAVVMLVVCANVANLLLARGESRRREMALRMALGASRRRLVTQLLTEATVLASVGGALGLALAWGGNRALLALAPGSLPRLDEIRVDWIVVAFSLALSAAAAFAFGIYPALRAAREDPAESMKATGKGTTASAGSARARRVLVVAEVALAMVLLSGAGMLVRSLIHLHRQDMGFDPAGTLTAKVSPNMNSYDEARSVQFHQQLLDRVRAVPGVSSAGAAGWLPVVDEGGSWDLIVQGMNIAETAHWPTATPQQVTPGYFAAIGLRILEGREFTDGDRENAPLVAIVSRQLAKQLWPGESPLGRRFRLGGKDSAWVTVVGVSGDIRKRGFTDTPEPMMYFPHAQTARSSYFVPRSMSYVLRARPGIAPQSLAAPVRSAVRALDATAPVSSVMTLDAVIGTSTAERRFSTALIAGFAALALLLAAIGIYGVISYAVSERTFEIGVRMALGAGRGEVLSLVVGDGAKLALAGIVIGVLGSAALARVIKSLLFDVPVVDVVTLSGVGLLLGLVAVGASALPARRAATVSPTEALRAG